MSNRKQVEVLREDNNPNKWCVALSDDVFKRFIMSQGKNNSNKVFGDGSLFSPLLFGKFFDPSDAFPLWEFESEILLCNLRSSGLSFVDWSKTDQDYVLRAELQGSGKSNVQVYAENQKSLEICGQWNLQRDLRTNNKDWRSGNWWEFGFVRRLELPEDADWKKVEVFLTNDTILELKIPRKNLNCDDPKNSISSDVSAKNYVEV